LPLLTFWNMRKACKKIVEKLENLSDVRFVQFKCSVQCRLVVLIKFEVKTVEVWNTAFHMLDHFVQKANKSRVVKWDPDVAREGRGSVVTHRTNR